MVAMRILVFTEGTVLTHRRWVGLPREEIVRHVKGWSNLSREEFEELRKSGEVPGLAYFADSFPIGSAVSKITAWKNQGATILYLTSRRTPEEVQIIRAVLKKYNFPDGELFFREAGEEYKDVAERVLPDIIVEDDCESIGGEEEMTYPRIKPVLKVRMKSIVVKEFGGIDHLPDDLSSLSKYQCKPHINSES
jgi:hypothetical protein